MLTLALHDMPLAKIIFATEGVSRVKWSWAHGGGIGGAGRGNSQAGSTKQKKDRKINEVWLTTQKKIKGQTDKWING